MLVLQRVRVFVRGRDLVDRPERRIALDDVEGAVGRVVVGRDLLGVELQKQLIEVRVLGQQAEALQEALLGRAPVGRRVLVLRREQVVGEVAPADDLVRNRLGRLKLADRRHLRDDGVDLRGNLSDRSSAPASAGRPSRLAHWSRRSRRLDGCRSGRGRARRRQRRCVGWLRRSLTGRRAERWNGRAERGAARRPTRSRRPRARRPGRQRQTGART